MMGTDSLLFRTAAAATSAVVLLIAITAAGVFNTSGEQAAEREDRRLQDTAAALARAEVAALLPPALTMNAEQFAERLESDKPLPMRRRHRHTSEARLPPRERLSVIAAGETVLMRFLEKQGQAVPVTLDADLGAGLSTHLIDGTPHRVCVIFLPGGRYTAAAEPLAVREAAVREIAFTAVMPLIALLVILPVVTALVLWRAMRPLRRTADEAARRSSADLQPLPLEGVPAEVRPLVEAVNTLLARVERARSREIRFTADAAHELRSPLTALTLEAERLSRLSLTPEARTAVEALEAGLARSVHQVSQLLHFARAQTGEKSAMQKDTQPWYASELAAEVLEPLLDEMERRRLKFEAEGLDDGLPVKGLPRAAVQAVLRNLLENAVRYSPDGGSVTLRAKREPGALILTVSDTGPGIPESERSRVFDPFYRMAGTGRTGTGLGLAIVRTYADMTGAEVTLCDADPDRTPPGLRAEVRFPLS